MFYANLKRILALNFPICLIGLAGFCTSAVYAGVPAGTVISNAVTLNYSVGGVGSVVASNTASFVVAEIINLTLTVQDAAPVAVNAPDASRAVTVLLTNTGNGSEAFSLSRNNALPGDQFDPVNALAGAIFLESGAQAGFQASGPNADTLYVPGVNDPVLAADASRLIYVVSDIPAGVALGGLGNVGISARSLTPGASGANTWAFPLLNAADSAEISPSPPRAFDAPSGSSVSKVGRFAAPGTRITDESFESSYTSTIDRVFVLSGAVTIIWRPRTVMGTGALVVSNSISSAASPVTIRPCSLVVKWAIPA